MKILRFETKDHPILGNCKIDFSHSGKPSDIVLIAGSNGSGKTTILNEIFDFLERVHPARRNYDVKITFSLESYEAALFNTFGSTDSVLTVESLRHPTPTTLYWSQIKVTNSKHEEIYEQGLVQSEAFQNLLKVVYSTVEINFPKTDIKSTTAKDIDSEKIPKEKSSGNIYTDIAQLLVDIKTLDNQDAADWIDENKDKNITVVPQEKRISRFKRAFDYMIEGKTFVGIKNEDEKKKIYFKDSEGTEIDLSALSSGEKQIVFRAGYLLKNIKELSGGIVLIDEPEISFHPTWQEKYIEFVRKIFSNEEGLLQVQIIIATHSPFIVQNTNISDEKIIILEKTQKGVQESKWPKFFGYTAPEPIFVPMEKISRHLLLVEGKGDKTIILHAWKRLFPQKDIDFDVKWAGEPNDGGAGTLQRHLIALSQHAITKVLGLFDADTRGLNDWNGTKIKGKPSHDFVEITDSFKVLDKVGATYLPVPPGRDFYFCKSNPMFSMLTTELFFSDSALGILNIVKADPIEVFGQKLIVLKDNHSVEETDLAKLKDEDFTNFICLFDHIEESFNKIS